jgi:hypothetical protein
MIIKKMGGLITLIILFILLLNSVRADFTIVVLPDTQGYAENYPKIFLNQTNWIADNVKEKNIVMVIHEGDIVNQQLNETQWKNANQSMSILDGKVPYILSVGNHDMGSTEEDAGDRSTQMYNRYFPYTRYEKENWYGGHMDSDNDNYYVLFEEDKLKFMVITLEFGPNQLILDWANEAVANHKDRQVIVVTHAYLDIDNKRQTWTSELNPHRYGIEKEGIKIFEYQGVVHEIKSLVDINLLPKIEKIKEANVQYVDDSYGVYYAEHINETDHLKYYVESGGPFAGEEIWDLFIKKHKNIFMVLSGHILYDGSGFLVSKGDNGNDVYQIAINYQFLPHGGDGWLNTFKFVPEEDKIYANSYSPYLGYNGTEYKYTLEQINFGEKNEILNYLVAEKYHYTLDYNMSADSDSWITGAVIGPDGIFRGFNLILFVGIMGLIFVLIVVRKRIQNTKESVTGEIEKVDYGPGWDNESL